MNTDPTMMVAISTPNAAASARPITTGPRMRMRTRHRSNETKRAVMQPGGKHVRHGQSTVEAAGQGQDGHADDGREQPEVGELAPVVDECLDADGAVGQPEMAVEDGPGLEVVEVVLEGRLPDGVGSLPWAPEDPHERNRGHDRSDDGGNREPPAAGGNL